MVGQASNLSFTGKMPVTPDLSQNSTPLFSPLFLQLVKN
jgi:hypothetical protein